MLPEYVAGGVKAVHVLRKVLHDVLIVLLLLDCVLCKQITPVKWILIVVTLLLLLLLGLMVIFLEVID